MKSANTKINLLKLTVVLVVGGLALLFVYRGHRPRQVNHKETPEEVRQRAARRNRAIDNRFTPLRALLKAPEGSTPCETAYNGFKAFDDSPNPAGLPRPFGKLPDRDMFLKRCRALSTPEQLCLQPRYSVQHQQECNAILPKIIDSTVVFDSTPVSGQR
jgi:hypothetical protein